MENPSLREEKEDLLGYGVVYKFNCQRSRNEETTRLNVADHAGSDRHKAFSNRAFKGTLGLTKGWVVLVALFNRGEDVFLRCGCGGCRL